jgi:glycogen phosphorylase
LSFSTLLSSSLFIYTFVLLHSFSLVERRSPGDGPLRSRVSIIEDSGGVPKIRMAHLAVVGSHSVNGKQRMKDTENQQRSCFFFFFFFLFR